MNFIYTRVSRLGYIEEKTLSLFQLLLKKQREVVRNKRRKNKQTQEKYNVPNVLVDL